jgi:excisionase family DNA binding protein
MKQTSAPSVDVTWWTLDEAAAYLRKCGRFVRLEIRAGRLKAARVGGRGDYRIRREWCDEYVERSIQPLPVEAA